MPVQSLANQTMCLYVQGGRLMWWLLVARLTRPPANFNARCRVDVPWVMLLVLSLFIRHLSSPTNLSLYFSTFIREIWKNRSSLCVLNTSCSSHSPGADNPEETVQLWTSCFRTLNRPCVAATAFNNNSNMNAFYLSGALSDAQKRFTEVKNKN